VLLKRAIDEGQVVTLGASVLRTGDAHLDRRETTIEPSGLPAAKAAPV
jgi:hypothetical protein